MKKLFLLFLILISCNSYGMTDQEYYNILYEEEYEFCIEMFSKHELYYNGNSKVIEYKKFCEKVSNCQVIKFLEYTTNNVLPNMDELDYTECLDENFNYLELKGE